MTKGSNMYPLLAGWLEGPQKKFPSFSKNIYLGQFNVLKLNFDTYLIADLGLKSKQKQEKVAKCTPC
jgi:hypothetical protein